MRERHVRLRGKRGKVLFYSPPRGVTWGDLFGMRLRETRFANDVLLSPADARDLAAELLRRADDLEARPHD
jgi:hypothetical protein